MLVEICNLLTIRRPRGRIVVRWMRLQNDRSRRLQTFLVLDTQCVLAGGIRKIGDPLSVRRPGGIALRGARRLREIPSIAVFGRNRENVAVRFEYGTNAAWRDRRVLNLLHNLNPMRTYLRQLI